MHVSFPGDHSEFRTTLANIPEGYNISDGVHPGWCHNEENPISSRKSYLVSLHSSCDENLPKDLQNRNWNMVNYILNHKQSASWVDVRDAIWYFTYKVKSLSEVAQAMVNEAVEKGADFVPKSGQVLAIICDAGPKVQLTFVEGVQAECDLFIDDIDKDDNEDLFCLSLPQEPIKMRVSYPGSISEFKTTLAEVPEGYDVTNGSYLGWCNDENIPIRSRVTYDAILYSSYSTNLPAYLQDKQWDMVNYILNHKQSYNRQDIQTAIWYFTNIREYPSAPQAQELVDDALANGAGFVPESPQVVAIICDAGPEVQPTAIEVVLPICNTPTEDDDKKFENACFKLPQTPINMRVAYPSDNSEFGTTLAHVPEGYSIADGIFPGWCHDEENPLSSWKSYKVNLFSSYAEKLPTELQDRNWGMVNYILNHKESASWVDVRDAIWYFTYKVKSLSAVAQALVNEAVKEGENFVPKAGQVLAVICDAGSEVQLTFIEVVLPSCIVPIAPELPEAQITKSQTKLDNVPLQTRLMANYPNPFNPETWIPFELAEDSNIKVEIYDMTGRIIRTLDLGYRPAGHYIDRSSAVRWDGRNASGERVASGVYLYRLLAGDFSALRRMVILK